MSVSGPVLLATRSTDKLREIRVILRVCGIDIITLDEAGVEEDPAEDHIEQFDTFVENAHAKAAHFMKLSKLPTLADDSGICVAALNGAPGVRSRRFAGAAGRGDQDRSNNARLLELLRDVPDDGRQAYYACAAAFHHPDGRTLATLGTCAGFILREPRGDGGFGYDPVFLDPGSGLAFGEMSAERKLRISHRTRAFHAMASLL